VWVIISYRESLRGYYMLVEFQDTRGSRHRIYSSANWRQLLGCQKALAHLRVRVPHLGTGGATECASPSGPYRGSERINSHDSNTGSRRLEGTSDLGHH
jgi:hypothetical protein